MSKANATVEELVGMIGRGELRLPEMQREYVWQSTRVRDLLDSLYRGYPSGTILLWETDETVPLREFSVAQESNPYQTTRLLLDGQQRLTSLSAVLRGEPVSVRSRKRPIELLFNLEHPEKPVFAAEVDENGSDDDAVPEEDEQDASEDELMNRFSKMTFVVATRKLESLPMWVRVSDIFKSSSDTAILKTAGVSSMEDPRLEKYSKRLARLRNIRKYEYRMDVLERSLSYDEVTEIFVRVNSLGAKLRSSDLALAQITAKWRNSLAVFQAFQKQCAQFGYDLDLGIHLKNMVAFATGQSRFRSVGNLSLETLQASWKDSVEGMEFAINFMRSNTDIDSPILLSSPFILIVLAFYGGQRKYSLSADEMAQLRYWTLLANAKGRFSRGSSETILDQDLAALRQGGGVDGMLERLRTQVGRLNITPEELDGRNQRSALFKTMFLAFRAQGAKDWASNLLISLAHTGSRDKLQFHHIFPKAVLRAAHYSSREADDIANLAFIGGKTNRQISDKQPAKYFPDCIKKAGAGAFEAQCIPTQAGLLYVDSYKEFLRQRRDLIAKRLNVFLGQSASDESKCRVDSHLSRASGDALV